MTALNGFGPADAIGYSALYAQTEIISMSTTNPSNDEPRLVSMKHACELTSLSRTMLNRYRSEGRFPAAVPLGDKRIAFLKSEIVEWIAGRVAARGANDNKAQTGRVAA